MVNSHRELLLFVLTLGLKGEQRFSSLEPDHAPGMLSVDPQIS